MWMVVGLGNPGPRYAETRHNVGFRVVDELARRWGGPSFKTKFGGELATGSIRSEKVVYFKPMEYMNVSGYAVQRAADFYSVQPERMIIVHDEIDLPFSRLRLKSGGGHGGHNGVRSLMEQLGNGDFLRVRMGVGKPAGGGGASWVLGEFGPEEAPQLPDFIGRASDAVERILDRGIRAAMNEFNPKDSKEPTKERNEK
jgi:PTH1 family peptidyl-tRNA hydrolase